MPSPIHRPRRRRAALAALGAGATLLALPLPALAGPIHTLSASPTGLSGAAGNLLASTADNSIRTTGPVAAGHRAGVRYCSPWANSTVRTLSTRTSRWHADPHIGYIRVLGASGEAGRIPESQQGYQGSLLAREWSLNSPCATLEFYASGAKSHSGIWTAQIVAATIEDHQGPSVSGVSAPQGWITGNAVPVSFATADNGLGQGGVLVSVGSAVTDAGNLALGARTVSAGLGGLPDGRHTVTVSRAGVGWPAHAGSTQVSIDRTPPAAPTPRPATTAWSKDPVAVSAAATGDGTGSGWKENQLSIDGGLWASGNRVIVSTDGVHTVAARAVDRAGHISSARTATVRIDRGAPGGRLVGVRRVAPGAVVATVSVADARSGIASWTLLDGTRVLASGTGAGREIIITGLAGTRQLRLVAKDVAGNSATVATTSVDFGAGGASAVTAAPPQVAADLGPAPPYMRLGIPREGLAGARIAKGTPIPFWTRRIRGIGTRRAYALNGVAVRLKLKGITTRARVGRRAVPLVRVSGSSNRRVVRARFTTASGSPLPYPYVIVRDPDGEIVETRRGGRRGHLRFRVDRRQAGRWTLELWGRPSRRFAIVVRPGARITTSLRAMTIPSRSRISVTGRVRPASRARGHVVQLQWLDETAGARGWRPIVNGRVRRDGRFALRYRFRRAGGYAVKMRVVMLGSPGMRSLRTSPRAVTVLP